MPSTRMEDEKLGEVSDQVKETAKQTGQEALERGKHVAQEAGQAAMQTAREEGGRSPRNCPRACVRTSSKHRVSLEELRKRLRPARGARPTAGLAAFNGRTRFRARRQAEGEAARGDRRVHHHDRLVQSVFGAVDERRVPRTPPE